MPAILAFSDNIPERHAISLKKQTKKNCTITQLLHLVANHFNLELTFIQPEEQDKYKSVSNYIYYIQ